MAESIRSSCSCCPFLLCMLRALPAQTSSVAPEGAVRVDHTKATQELRRPVAPQITEAELAELTATPKEQLAVPVDSSRVLMPCRD
mmetsp:Transcript_344/g.721  ORF Transcript_344/g.721 Transcript_344/m.721 type:complete len:86 (+) Transcript_344:406-663(+)